MNFKTACFALDPNLSAIITDNTETETQPQARTSAVAPGSEEWIKNFIYMLRLDADAIVVEFDADQLIAAALDIAGRYAQHFLSRRFGSQGMLRVTDYIYHHLA